MSASQFTAQTGTNGIALETNKNASDHAIKVSGLVKRYGKTSALDRFDMTVPTGRVYALLGRNGAGKSTLVQLLMGMMDCDAGEIDVLGFDPFKQPEALKQRVGYIPDRLPMYEWMTVAEILHFTGSFYESWSKDDQDRLIQQFHLDVTKKVSSLSRGYRALLALVMAMSHNPDLVLLDECTSGMDAIARREFERSVIDALQRSGRSVLFAGHQIDEMERICDYVGIVKEGKMLLEMPIDTLKDRVKLLRIAGSSDTPLVIPGAEILENRQAGRERIVTVKFDKSSSAVVLPSGFELAETVDLTLEEIFVALMAGSKG